MGNADQDHTQRYERGEIQREILKFILAFENGVEEPEIREYLKTNFGITAPKGVKLHLENLSNKGLLVKEERRGAANIWTLNYENKVPVGEYIIENYLNREFSASNLEKAKIGREYAWQVFQMPGIKKYISSNSFWYNFLIVGMHELIYSDTVKDSYSKNGYFDLCLDDSDANFLNEILERTLPISITLFRSMFAPNRELFSVFDNYIDMDFETISDEDLFFFIYGAFIFSAILVDTIKYREKPRPPTSDIISKLLNKKESLIKEFERMICKFDVIERNEKLETRIQNLLRLRNGLNIKDASTKSIK